ncbi:hypothetical protein C1752_01523 [Acaryochloris thomasi RCC1774]|uniref:Uncharacterized protein n=2 Tax=Acaryochloris TaxID=155977 RepID=A0A2W1JTU7_9CYAN|nr:hypothetical protein C1752_01523 [Acaryochloris thomasi RCC1774]
MKYLLTTLMIMTLVPLKSSATTRDPIIGESKACYTQLDTSKRRLLGIKSLRIFELGASKYTSAATERPKQYTHAYEFVLKGNGGKNLLASPVLMNNIATEILTRCPSIGSVAFKMSQTDQSASFGKKQEGSISRFICVSNPGELKWGTQLCP